MRLNIDRWSSSSIALELIPCGRVRPTAAYFRAGHLLLDSLAHSLSQQVPAAHARSTQSQPSAVIVPEARLTAPACVRPAPPRHELQITVHQPVTQRIPDLPRPDTLRTRQGKLLTAMADFRCVHWSPGRSRQ